VVLSAGIFGYMHFPNFALMAGTFVLGLALLQVYQRHRNLLAIATTHALLAVGFNGLASAYFWLSRAVGPAFLLPL
jgi:membrane protease YdiL (CAAX protease family)